MMKTRPMHIYKAIIFALILVVGCDKEELEMATPNTKVYHPTSINLPSTDSPNYLKPAIDSNLNLPSITNAIRVGNDRSTSANKLDIFGEIVDVKKWNGKYLVLDKQLNTIRFYDSAGALLTDAKMAGRGPGEFLGAVGMDIKNDTLFVADSFGRLNQYKLSNDTLLYVDSEVLEIGPEDLCSNNNHVIVRAIKVNQAMSVDPNASILHQFSTKDLSRHTSRGNAYMSPNWLVVNQMSDGPVFCSQKSDQIVYAYEYLPYVYSLGPDNQINWIVDISEQFEQFQLIEAIEDDGQPSLTFSGNDEDKGEQIKYLYHDLENSQLYIQSTLVDRSEGSMELSTKTYLVDLNNNRVSEPSLTYPVIHDLNDSEKILSQTYPFPQLIIEK